MEMTPEQLNEPNGPSTTSQQPNDLLDLNPTAFVDDLYNSVHHLCAEGFDELDREAREGLSLNEVESLALVRGTANIYQALKKELDSRLEIFEQYALEEILKVPPGLLTQPAQDDANVAEVDEAEEKAADEKLKQLRKDIAAAKRTMRSSQQEILELQHLMDSCSGQLEKLSAVPDVLAAKENLLEDITAIADKGKQLESGFMKLEALRKEKSDKAASLTAVNDLSDAAVEKEILRRQSGMKSAPLDELKRLQDRLIAGGGSTQ